MRLRVPSHVFVVCFCFATAQLSISPRAVRADDPPKSAAPKDALASVASKGSLVNALPKETTFLLRAANMKSLVAKLKSSPAYALKDNADVKALLARIEKETSQGLANAQKELGFDPVDFLLSIDGEWVVAIGNLDAVASAVGESLSVGQAPQNLSPEIVPVVIAADASSSQDKVRDHLDKIFAFAEKKGAKRETVDWKGGKITRISEASSPVGERPEKAKNSEKDGGAGSSKPPDDSGKGKKELKDGKGKSDLVARESAGDGDKDDGKKDKDKAKDKDIDKDDDDDGKLEDNKDDAAAPKHVPVSLYVGELAGRIYFSPSRVFLEGCMQKTEAPGPDSLASNALFQETQKMTGAGDFQAFVNVKQLTSSIGNALSTTFFAFFWQKFDALFFGKTLNNVGLSVSLEENAVRETLFAHNSGAADGILGVFKSEAFPVAVPSAVPGDSQTFTSFAFNPDHLGKIIKEVVQTAMAFQGQAQDVDALVESQVGVKLSEIVAGLGKRIHSFAGTPKSDNPFASLNYVLELRDEAPLKKLLKKISEMAQGDVQSEKFKDRELYSVDTGNFGLTFAAADKLFVLSGSRSEVEKVINRAAGSGPALAETEDFKKAISGLPAKVSMLGYSAPDYAKTSLKVLAEELKNGHDSDTDALVGALGALGEFLGTAITYGVWNDSGILADAKLFYRKK